MSRDTDNGRACEEEARERSNLPCCTTTSLTLSSAPILVKQDIGVQRELAQDYYVFFLSQYIMLIFLKVADYDLNCLIVLKIDSILIFNFTSIYLLSFIKNSFVKFNIPKCECDKHVIFSLFIKA